MRASRLVSLLLLLQSRGGQTAAELARELEVSVRSIHRDVEALSESGVPIYAERGPHGGIRLVDGYRTRLTGMTPDEAEALFLSGLPGPAAELGLGTVVAAARLKVLAALPPELRARASRITERFHFDAPGWFQPSDAVPFLEPLASAVWETRRVRMTYRRPEGTVAARDFERIELVLRVAPEALGEVVGVIGRDRVRPDHRAEPDGRLVVRAVFEWDDDVLSAAIRTARFAEVVEPAWVPDAMVAFARTILERGNPA